MSEFAGDRQGHMHMRVWLRPQYTESHLIPWLSFKFPAIMLPGERDQGPPANLPFSESFAKIHANTARQLSYTLYMSCPALSLSVCVVPQTHICRDTQKY